MFVFIYLFNIENTELHFTTSGQQPLSACLHFSTPACIRDLSE